MYNRYTKDWISFFSCLIFLFSPPIARGPLRSCTFSLGTVYSPVQPLLKDAKPDAEGALGSTK